MYALEQQGTEEMSRGQHLHKALLHAFRPMRPGEKHGVDYFFVSKEQFEKWIETGELCEWALVYGEYKGIPKSQVLLSAASCILQASC